MRDQFIQRSLQFLYLRLQIDVQVENGKRIRLELDKISHETYTETKLRLCASYCSGEIYETQEKKALVSVLIRSQIS